MDLKGKVGSEWRTMEGRGDSFRSCLGLESFLYGLRDWGWVDRPGDMD